MVNTTIFSPGQICGGMYSIVSVHARSPVTESYVARQMRTGQEVILTCSRLDDGDEGARLRSTFLANAAKLKATQVEGAAKVLDAALDGGVYWVAREHFSDATPLGVVTEAGWKGKDIPSGWTFTRGLSRRLAWAAAALWVGSSVASVMSEFTSKGIVHSALDMDTTLVMREDGAPIVLDTGYCALFGLKHFRDRPDTSEFRPPERALGRKSDARSDIYALGMAMLSTMAAASVYILDEVVPLEPISRIIARMTVKDPEQRIQSWREVDSAVGALQAEFEGRWMKRTTKSSPVAMEAPPPTMPSRIIAAPTPRAAAPAAVDGPSAEAPPADKPHADTAALKVPSAPRLPPSVRPSRPIREGTAQPRSRLWAPFFVAGMVTIAAFIAGRIVDLRDISMSAAPIGKATSALHGMARAPLPAQTIDASPTDAREPASASAPRPSPSRAKDGSAAKNARSAPFQRACETFLACRGGRSPLTLAMAEQ